MINLDSIIGYVTETLKNEGAEKVILFGSYANGTQNSGSDIDLMVIKNIPSSETRDFRIRLKKALPRLESAWQVINFACCNSPNAIQNVLIFSPGRLRIAPGQTPRLGLMDCRHLPVNVNTLHLHRSHELEEVTIRVS